MSRKSPWAVALLLAVPLLRPVAAAPAPSSAEALQPLARLSAAGTLADWQPLLADYDRLILTVAGPKDLVIRRDFEAGRDPSLNLTDGAGQPWPDGDYSYELRLVPKVKESISQGIHGDREAGRETLGQGSNIQIGVMSIRDGRVVMPDLAEISAPAVKNVRSDREGAVQRTVIAPPLIVQGDVCFGSDCLANEDPFDLLLKRDQPSITFQDTFGAVTGDRDWRLVANQLGTGNNFALRDLDGGTRPFVVDAGAPEAGLYLRSNGNLGLGTFPLKAVHMVNASSPTIRMEQTAGALSARTWDLVGNDVGFSIQDITGAKTPLRIRAAAPTGSVEVAADGSIGLGTTTPANRLHLFGSAGTTKMLIQEASGVNAFRELLELRNNGGTVLIFDDSSNAQRWSNGTSGPSFVMDEQAHAGVEFSLSNTGNLIVSGTVTPGSSREIKHDFVSVDPQAMLDRVVALPITSWAYNSDQKVRHIGPMSEDFYSAFQVGADDKGISVTDSAGVAFAAIQGLYALVTEKDAKLADVARANADLAQRNRDLDQRLARLEARLQSPDSSAPAAPVQ